MSGNLNRSKRAMKPYGNVTLMTLICIVVFWVFMALRPAQASGCGSSWAICAYRAQTHWYARNAMERRLEYRRNRQRILRGLPIEKAIER
jgi:hypothetical protein